MELLTRKEVSKYLKVSQRTTDKILQNKNFHGKIYIGRRLLVDKKKLDEYLKMLYL